MKHEEGDLEGVGGLRLYRQAWLPDGEPRASVVIAHGGAEHSGRYAWVAEQLTAAGYTVHALDHRGHGRSEGQPGYVDRFAHAVEDLDRLVREAGPPVFLLGHSMGGCLALLYAIEHQDRLEGLILSAPLASLDDVPGGLRIAARVLNKVAPKAGVHQVDASGVSTDPEVVKAYETDPLVYRGKLAARTVVEIDDAVKRIRAGEGRITLPLLVLSSPADTIVEPVGAARVHENAGSQDNTFHRYEGFAHELLNEPDKQRVMDDILSWLGARAGARPAPTPAQG
jgi:alpha-beta hydrolase superfamily lysophospholipase